MQQQAYRESRVIASDVSERQSKSNFKKSKKIRGWRETIPLVQESFRDYEEVTVMLDSSTLTFKHFTDPRVKSNPGFIEGLSGPLMLATDKSGRKYIVKHACFHNAANELVASWLGYKIGAPTPHAYLLKPSEMFPSMYGVAIQFIEGLKPMDPSHLTDQMQQDITAQFALNLLIDTDDKIQMSDAGGRIYSMDFSEAFYVSDTMMLKAFLFNEDAGKAWADNKLDAFCDHIRWLSFDVAREYAPDLHMDPEHMKAGMITVAKKVLSITDDEIDALAEELSKMYPEGYADYYAGCIYAMQERMKMF